MNVLLMGARASGKSTIGPLLAERLSMQFVDLDSRVLARFAPTTVKEVWQAHGEQEWRRAEVVALQEVLNNDRQLIALGGGTPMIAAARVAIDSARRSGTAFTIYLKCAPEILQARLVDQPGDRPGLTNLHPGQEIVAVLAERDPIYRDMADFVADTSYSTVQQTVDDLERQVRRFAPTRSA